MKNKKIKGSLDSFFEKVGTLLTPYLLRINRFLRWSSRKRLINRWAGKHPYQFFGLTFCSFGIILLMTFIPGQSDGTNIPLKDELQSVPNVNRSLNQLQAIQSVKDRQSKEVAQLIYDGARIRKQLDSLIAIPQKSHKDSLEIVRKHKQLKIIVNTIN